MSIRVTTDVLIAGVGPAGLALAAELKRLGVSPMIVDRQAAGANTSRAAVVHARTLEVLEPLGVTPDLIAEGVRVPVFRIRDRDRTLITIDFASIPSLYRFTLMCPQDRTERILLTHLERLSGSVLRPSELGGLEEAADHVDVQLEGERGAQSVRARWLVGGDGMHSRVREQSGIAFRGAAYEESFVLADVHMDWPLSREEVSLFFSPEGLVVVAPLPEQRYRIVAIFDDAPEAPSAAFMQDLLNRRGPTRNAGRIHDVAWSSRFRIHHRVAENPRKGRVLLVGDAAHVHSPAGGQGMNTGIQDGISLAQVLADTLRDGNEERVDAWAEERHKVATEVVALTHRLTRLATMKSGPGQALRNAALVFAGHLPPVTGALARNLAELRGR